MKDRGNSSVSLTNDSDFMSESCSQHSSMKSGRLGSSRRLSSGVLPRKRECGVFVRYTWTEALFAVLQLNVARGSASKKNAETSSRDAATPEHPRERRRNAEISSPDAATPRRE